MKALNFSCLLLLHNVCAYQPSWNIPNQPQQQSQQNQDKGNKMRAWHCHGRSQNELVSRLREANIVTSLQTQKVMQWVDRQYYVPQFPYQDSPQPIAKSQTISAPHMHAHVLEEILPVLLKQHQLHPQDPVKILDVGCGSGYLTACLGRWFQAPPSLSPPQDGRSINSETAILPFAGRVYGIDIHSELVELSTANINKADSDLLDNKIVTLRVGNGWQGWKDEAPFDAIHVGAAAPTFPVDLALQLRLHGVLICPVGPTNSVQTLLRVERMADTGNFKTDFALTELLGVRYVPLVQGPGS